MTHFKDIYRLQEQVKELNIDMRILSVENLKLKLEIERLKEKTQDMERSTQRAKYKKD